jgi:hypothetical protein
MPAGRFISHIELHKQNRFPVGSIMNRDECIGVQLLDHELGRQATWEEIRMKFPRMASEIDVPPDAEA